MCKKEIESCLYIIFLKLLEHGHTKNMWYVGHGCWVYSFLLLFRLHSTPLNRRRNTRASTTVHCLLIYNLSDVSIYYPILDQQSSIWFCSSPDLVVKIIIYNYNLLTNFYKDIKYINDIPPLFQIKCNKCAFTRHYLTTNIYYI